MGMCMGAYTNVSCVVYSIPEQKLGFSVKDFCCKKRVLELLDALFKAKHKIKNYALTNFLYFPPKTFSFTTGWIMTKRKIKKILIF